MRRYFIALGVFVVAFAIGLGNFWLSQKLPWRSSVALPYCEVARNADSYHNKNIRVRARLIFGSDGIYVFEDCDPVEALASTVNLEGTKTGGRGYVDEVLVTGDQPRIKTAEAIIEGHFNGEASTGCWRPKFHIEATRIHLISPVSEYVPPQSEGEGLRMKH